MSALIGIPLALIIANTLIQILSDNGVLNSEILKRIFNLIGHPFTALIIANLLAWYLLGIRRGMSRTELLQITSRSLTPVGMILLLIGAGGVFKQVLVDTGSGEMLAKSMTSLGIPVFLFAFLAAALIRILQGSATVAMITSAGLTAPLLMGMEMNDLRRWCCLTPGWSCSAWAASPADAAVLRERLFPGEWAPPAGTTLWGTSQTSSFRSVAARGDLVVAVDNELVRLERGRGPD